MPSFHKELDNVFDKIINIYGNTDNILKYKMELLDTYENEEKRRSAKLAKLLKPKHFQIDANGNIKQVFIDEKMNIK